MTVGEIAKRLECGSPLPPWGRWRVSEVSDYSTPQRPGRESGRCAARRDRRWRKGVSLGGRGARGEGINLENRKTGRGQETGWKWEGKPGCW